MLTPATNYMWLALVQYRWHRGTQHSWQICHVVRHQGPRLMSLCQSDGTSDRTNRLINHAKLPHHSTGGACSNGALTACRHTVESSSLSSTGGLGASRHNAPTPQTPAGTHTWTYSAANRL